MIYCYISVIKNNFLLLHIINNLINKVHELSGLISILIYFIRAKYNLLHLKAILKHVHFKKRIRNSFQNNDFPSLRKPEILLLYKSHDFYNDQFTSVYYTSIRSLRICRLGVKTWIRAEIIKLANILPDAVSSQSIGYKEKRLGRDSLKDTSSSFFQSLLILISIGNLPKVICIFICVISRIRQEGT